MKIFNYSQYIEKVYDSEILGLVAQIHEYKGRQNNLNGISKFKFNKLVEIAKIQSTEASNKIEGIITTSVRIKQLCENKTTPKNRDEKEIFGYRDVLNTIHESFSYIPIKSSYILQLHKDLYKYSEKAIGGKFKNSQNYISEQRADGTSFVRFMPLEPYETPEAVERLCEEFNIVASKASVDPLILIPIFILDFLCIHPFNDGNGRMSRLLTTLLLYKFDYFIGKYISLEKLIEETKTEYYDALQQSSIGWNANENNVSWFIKYMLRIILRAYRELEERIKVVGENKLSATKQVEKAVKTMYAKFTKKDILQLCPSISEVSVERALKQLLNQKQIIKHGERKSTFYTRNIDFN